MQPSVLPTLFGPRLEGERGTFRLWAPAADAVLLEIDGQPPVPMSRTIDGWHQVSTACAAGTRYAFRVNGTRVPDPASRAQSGGVHGFSVVSDPESYPWATAWKGRPWEEAVIYETHVGLEGGFAKLGERLSSLRDLGVTAIELMPIAAFPGTRNWGYDAVLPFAPAESYGTPTALKALIDRAHALSQMMILDVVYNHFGPDGNYLGLYAPQFFRKDIKTPWGDAMDFSKSEVRNFFIENALYWINEFRFDGLRLDAVHAIADKEFLFELAESVRRTAGDRAVHLVLENDDNDSSLLEGAFDAQWNDDFHHAAHVLLTGEHTGYYKDHAENPAERLARVLREGFDYQGELSRHRGKKRGTTSAHLPPTAFVSFLQNHDQVGNRGLGERLPKLSEEAPLRAAIALLLLSPQIPLLFFGEELGSVAPFYYFTEHGPELAEAVRVGRMGEFPAMDPEVIADPNALETFRASSPFANAPQADAWRTFYRELLRVRHTEIAPRLKGALSLDAKALGPRAVMARWRLADASVLTLAANLAQERQPIVPPASPLIYGSCDTGLLPAATTAAWLGPA